MTREEFMAKMNQLDTDNPYLREHKDEFAQIMGHLLDLVNEDWEYVDAHWDSWFAQVEGVLRDLTDFIDRAEAHEG